jgi:hypothetical protein
MNTETDPLCEVVTIDVADLRSLISVLRGQSLPLDMEPWRDALLNRLTHALEAEADQSAPAATLVDVCSDYLARMHSVLFGQFFDISKPAGRRRAAEWLADQVEAVNQLCGQQ